MNKKLFAPIFLSLILWISCDNSDDSEEGLQPFSTDICEIEFPTPDSLRYEAVHNEPIFTGPTSSIYYSNEIVPIKWTLPDNLRSTELQIIQFTDSYDCSDYEKFHKLNNQFTVGYGGQTVHYFSTSELLDPIQDSIFVSYRARATDIESPKGYSKWTDVKNFVVVPLSHLDKSTITVPYTINFVAEETENQYYSGVVSFQNYKLRQISNDYNLDYDKIRLVRITNLEGEFITQFGNGENPFSKLTVGFNEEIDPNENVYPFIVFGEIFPGSFEESPIRGNLYETLTKNIISEMNNYDLKMAYVLEDTIGSQHEVIINLTFEIFSDY